MLPKIGGVSVVLAEKRWSCKVSQILPPSLQDFLQRAQLRTKSRPQLTSSPGCEDHEEEQSNKANKSLVRYSRLKVKRGKLKPVELSSSPIDEKEMTASATHHCQQIHAAFTQIISWTSGILRTSNQTIMRWSWATTCTLCKCQASSQVWLSTPAVMTTWRRPEN